MSELKQSTMKIVLPILLSGLIGVGGGAGGSAYMQGKSDSQIQSRLLHLEDHKVNVAEFTKMEGLLISMAVNLCELRSKSNPSAVSDCSQIRFNYYNAN